MSEYISEGEALSYNLGWDDDDFLEWGRDSLAEKYDAAKLAPVGSVVACPF